MPATVQNSDDLDFEMETSSTTNSHPDLVYLPVHNYLNLRSYINTGRELGIFTGKGKQIEPELYDKDIVKKRDDRRFKKIRNQRKGCVQTYKHAHKRGKLKKQCGFIIKHPKQKCRQCRTLY